jgi:hypothetical protein
MLADRDLRRQFRLAGPAGASAALTRYLEAAARVDLSGCPVDFRHAHFLYLEALRDLERASRELPGGPIKGLMLRAANALAPNALDEGFDPLAETLRAAAERYCKRAGELDRLAAEYGDAP